jgi:two-component system, LytTR family, sensor kinase
MSVTYKKISAHIAAWMVYVLILILGALKPDRSFWINTLCSLIPVIILFYVILYFLFPRFLQQRQYISLIAFLILFNFGAICFRLVLVMIMTNTPMTDFVNGLLSPIPFWNQFRVNVLFIGISFAYWYAQISYRGEKDRQRLEKEIVDARLLSLKNQINPHFLYNTLSFLYTKSLPYSSELSGAIARLSEMMRYSLAELDQDGKVSLEKEVRHLTNFIEIHQLRFDNKLKVNFDVQGDFSECRIMPLLLITFVENAFKHGKLNDSNHPAMIRLCVAGKDILFRVQNKKAIGLKEKSNGIGLENVRNRLGLAYPRQHELVIENNHDEYIVNLKLSLQT